MNRELATELRCRAEADQMARQHWLATGETGDLPQIDASNTAWLKAITAEYGWPGISLVGEQGAEAAWLLAQHADRDVPFQRKALKLLQGAVSVDDARPRHLAYLTDRVLVADGRAQLYGTQYAHEADGPSLRPQPIADPEHLDERRAAMGLEPHAEYDQRMREK
ncbi:DUF6624 domain-containing protein [Streptomyces sp. NPDC046984]|uniref:DUF6624 domain-containing protein n=1 Tax=Streptomyces sp. NPDC046984 TaxID=3155138 RepID=UPI0033FD2B3B